MKRIVVYLALAHVIIFWNACFIDFRSKKSIDLRLSSWSYCWDVLTSSYKLCWLMDLATLYFITDAPDIYKNHLLKMDNIYNTT